MCQFFQNLFAMLLNLMCQFFQNLFAILLNLLFTIGLPFAAFIGGEVLSDARYPQGGSPFSGVGVFGSAATFALWCTWHERSLKVPLFLAVVRIVLCYLFAFIPVFWLLKSNNALGAGVCAALAYYLTGAAALHVSTPLPPVPPIDLERGAGQGRLDDPQGKTQSSSGNASVSPRPGEGTLEEMKRLTQTQRPKK